MFPDEFAKKKGPKTDLDKKFLLIVEQAMSKRGIQSDRAMSIELDRHPNFMNRVRNGLQSAPPEAWDALFAKYPEAQNTTTNVMAQGGGQAIGTNHGTATQYHNASSRTEEVNQVDIIIQLENTQVLLIEAKRYAAQLESQLADKERIIKLLEQSLNKPS